MRQVNPRGDVSPSSSGSGLPQVNSRGDANTTGLGGGFDIPYHIRVKLDADTPIDYDTETLIDGWEDEIAPYPGAFHDDSVNPEQIGFPISGYYRIRMNMYWEPIAETFNTATKRIGYIYKNGDYAAPYEVPFPLQGDYKNAFAVSGSEDGQAYGVGDVVLFFAQGDYITARVKQQAGGIGTTLDLLAETYLEVTLIENFSGAAVRVTSNQSVSSGAPTITFGDTLYDTDNYFDGTSTFSLPSDGVYLIWAMIIVGSATVVAAGLYINTTVTGAGPFAQWYREDRHDSTGFTWCLSGMTWEDVVETDEISMTADVQSAGSVMVGSLFGICKLKSPD